MGELDKRPHSPPSRSALVHNHLAPRKRNESMMDIGACVSAGSGAHRIKQDPHKKRKRRKDLGVWGTLRTSIVEHQIGISINLLLLLTFTHLILPAARPTTSRFFSLQYPTDTSGVYTRGTADLPYVVTWVVLFTGLREATMTYLLHPLASLAGIAKPKQQTRFAEQAWLFLYYIAFWSWGMHIYVTSDYFLDLPKLWADFPVREMSGALKAYYLIQFAFWLQQIVVVNIEERRKDHWQMFTHHIVTCLLLVSSYGYYQTRVGNVILCLMDVVDLVFSPAKMLKYAGYQTACDFMFGVFILAWFLARHVAYLAVCWSVYADVARVMTFGCYSPVTGEMTSLTPPAYSRFVPQTNSDGVIPPGGNEIWTNIIQPYAYPNETVCYNNKMKYVFLALLLFLQGITVMWFMMIMRVAYRVLKGEGADDSRSDDEGSDNEEGDDYLSDEYKHPADGPESDLEKLDLHKPLRPVEQVVGVEGLNIARKSSPMSRRFNAVRKEQGSSSSIGVPKEILNRIGCDSKTTGDDK